MAKLETRSLQFSDCVECPQWKPLPDHLVHLQSVHRIAYPVRGRDYIGRKLKPLTRRIVQCSPIAESDLDVVLDVASSMPWSRVDDPAHPFDRVEDSTFVYETVRTLAVTAVHISDLPRFRSEDLIRAEHPLWKGWVLTWRRVKNDRRLMSPILSWDVDMLEWLPRYLDKPKPRSEPAYLDLLHRLSDRIKQERGVRIHLNGNRFRHTGATRYKRAGLTDHQVAVMIGTSDRTMGTYVNDDVFEIFAKLESPRATGIPRNTVVE